MLAQNRPFFERSRFITPRHGDADLPALIYLYLYVKFFEFVALLSKSYE